MDRILSTVWADNEILWYGHGNIFGYSFDSFLSESSVLSYIMQLGQGNIIFGYSFDSFLSESSLKNNNGARRHFLCDPRKQEGPQNRNSDTIILWDVAKTLLLSVVTLLN